MREDNGTEHSTSKVHWLNGFVLNKDKQITKTLHSAIRKIWNAFKAGFQLIKCISFVSFYL